MLAPKPQRISHKTGRPFPRLTSRQPIIAIVDPRVEDFRDWRPVAQAHGARLKFFTTAQEALRFANCNLADLWVVNTDLPGLSGIELTSMLKTRSQHATVYLLANQYTPEIERRAWSARSTLFGCKPAHGEWLSQWFAHQSTNSAPVPAAARLLSPC